MKIYLISQDKNNGWDTYDSAVVCAENEEKARLTHPSEDSSEDCEEWDGIDGEPYGSWTNYENVKVEYIGEATPSLKKGVICASFNAG